MTERRGEGHEGMPEEGAGMTERMPEEGTA